MAFTRRQLLQEQLNKMNMGMSPEAATLLDTPIYPFRGSQPVDRGTIRRGPQGIDVEDVLRPRGQEGRSPNLGDALNNLLDQSDDYKERLRGGDKLKKGTRRVKMDMPDDTLTPSERRAREVSTQLINRKLAELGLGGLAVGGAAALINDSQGELDTNAAVPLAQGVANAYIGGTAGGFVGYGLQHLPGASPEAMARAYDAMPGEPGPVKDAAFARRYGKEFNIKGTPGSEVRRLRGMRNGAAIGAGGAALLQLIDAFRTQPQQVMLPAQPAQPVAYL